MVYQRVRSVRGRSEGENEATTFFTASSTALFLVNSIEPFLFSSFALTVKGDEVVVVEVVVGAGSLEGSESKRSSCVKRRAKSSRTALTSLARARTAAETSAKPSASEKHLQLIIER